jgi:ATP-dependent helicase/DNAse subunit B
MLRGSLIHGALSNLHRQLNQTAGSQVSPTTQSAEAFEKQALEVLATLMESLATSDPLASALREVDRRVLSQWLMNYYEQHQHYDDACMASGVPFRPAHFEVEFGPEYAAVDDEAGLHVESDKLRTSQPLELKVADQTIRISGRIDRVDLGQIAGQAVFHVIDYKSSTKVDFKPEMIASGERLQLPLYALALEQLLLADRGAIPWRASYWLVKEKGVRHRAMLDFHELVDGQIQPTEAWQAVREQLLEIVARLVKGIRGGQFPVYCADDACTSRCEFHTVCRIGQIRSLEKVWQIGGLPEVSS